MHDCFLLGTDCTQILYLIATLLSIHNSINMMVTGANH